jgi:hypothetical protein
MVVLFPFPYSYWSDHRRSKFHVIYHSQLLTAQPMSMRISTRTDIKGKVSVNSLMPVDHDDVTAL